MFYNFMNLVNYVDMATDCNLSPPF